MEWKPRYVGYSCDEEKNSFIYLRWRARNIIFYISKGYLQSGLKDTSISRHGKIIYSFWWEKKVAEIMEKPLLLPYTGEVSLLKASYSSLLVSTRIKDKGIHLQLILFFIDCPIPFDRVGLHFLLTYIGSLKVWPRLRVSNPPGRIPFGGNAIKSTIKRGIKLLNLREPSGECGESYRFVRFLSIPRDVSRAICPVSQQIQDVYRSRNILTTLGQRRIYPAKGLLEIAPTPLFHLYNIISPSYIVSLCALIVWFSTR